MPDRQDECRKLFVLYVVSYINYIIYYHLLCIIYQSCAPPRRHRRHFADAAADADLNWSTRRCRRRRPNVGVAPAPFSWRVHVMLYTSYMLLDFCNAVYNEAWTLTKSSKNDAVVFCNSPWYSNETRHRQSKRAFVDNFVKIMSDAKSFIWNFFGNLVNIADGTVKAFNSVYCNNWL